MSYFMGVILIGLITGLIAVASNPSPYFAALGLVIVAGLGCALLGACGGTFLSLILFLIYLGGMLVVFAYSAALAAEPYPEGWGSRSVMVYMGAYALIVSVAYNAFSGGWAGGDVLPGGESDIHSLFCGDTGGVALMYSTGGAVLMAGAWALLLTLIVALELTRGLERGALRVV